MRILLAIVLAALFAGFAFWQSQHGADQAAALRGGESQPAFVDVTNIHNQPFRDRVSALGTLKAWESVDITASVSQIVTQIKFEDGQQVQRGDVLAVLKQESERATLKELEANLAEAKREVRRLENLARQNQVAQTELDKARTQEAVTGFKIEEINARLADRTITAPFSGVLGLREVSEGALLSPGQRLTTLDDVSRVRLDFSVPAIKLGFLKVGSEVEATTPAFEQSFSGRVSAIGSRVDPVSRAVIARAVIDNADGVLKPGLLLEVTLLGPQRSALLVPEESLQSRSAQHYVWRVDGDQAVRTEVTLGGRSPGWVEVLAGVKAGDFVVRHGVGKLRGTASTIAYNEDN